MTIKNVQLSQKATGDQKSKINNEGCFELVLTCYDDPQKLLELIRNPESTYTVEITE